MVKTVYILGAGFSKDLNAPLQSQIIKSIFSLNGTLTESQMDENERELFHKCAIDFKNFLERDLFIRQDDLEKISLEDIYTPIDRCIIDNQSFRNINKTELIELRQKINALLIMLFRYKLKSPPQKEYVEKFCKFLVEIKRQKRIEEDPFAILSLNWDIIIDDALHKEISDGEGVVDYCCYVTPYNTHENIKPGLLARGQGMFNIKLLKLHGSMNWLQCQRCQRLYITFDEKIAIEEFLSKPKCRLCNKNFKGEKTIGNEQAILTSQLIMPTFLKDLNNVQLKLIWQNAGIELSEANRIVFMGYSFPAADFELRQLLARFVRHNAKIEVVLTENDKNTNPNQDSPESRYRAFFGKRHISFFFNGVGKYIDTYMNPQNQFNLNKTTLQ